MKDFLLDSGRLRSVEPGGTVRPSERSAAWLAHHTGGVGVGGSNPLAPTKFSKDISQKLFLTCDLFANPSPVNARRQ
jgi:hypothetical protein